MTEKFDYIDHQSVNYILVNSEVVQKIENFEAGFLWIFLKSLQNGFRLNRDILRKYLNMEVKKFDECLEYLYRCNLIEHVRHKNREGNFEGKSLKIKDGSDFISIKKKERSV